MRYGFSGVPFPVTMTFNAVPGLPIGVEAGRTSAFRAACTSAAVAPTLSEVVVSGASEIFELSRTLSVNVPLVAAIATVCTSLRITEPGTTR